MSNNKSRKHISLKHKDKRTKSEIATYSSVKRAYTCHLCKLRHDQLLKEWEPWELPRHLEKAHGFPEEASILRMKLIPNWDKPFEKEYLQNLEKEIAYQLEPVPSVEIDNIPEKFKKETERQKKREQEASRESD